MYIYTYIYIFNSCEYRIYDTYSMTSVLSDMFVYIYIYMYIYIHTYIYIYTYRLYIIVKSYIMDHALDWIACPHFPLVPSSCSGTPSAGWRWRGTTCGTSDICGTSCGTSWSPDVFRAGLCLFPWMFPTFSIGSP